MFGVLGIELDGIWVDFRGRIIEGYACLVDWEGLGEMVMISVMIRVSLRLEKKAML